MINWKPIQGLPHYHDVYLTDGGFLVQGALESVDYDEFRDEDIIGFVYGPAEIDPSNFHPTHYAELDEINLPVPEVKDEQSVL